MRIAFLGTSSFAVPALRALTERHTIALVVTQPDRPSGRHAVVVPPPVKRAAIEAGLPIFQPERVNEDDVVGQLRDSRPDVLVVASYGQLLRPAAFGLASLGAINIHASLLPRYRGAAPVHWAIVNGEETTGVTTFVIDRGMDTGPILLSRRLSIGADETAGELEAHLALLGADVMVETLDRLTAGTLLPVPQPDGATMAPKLTRNDGHVDWAVPARVVHNLVRGMTPWPGAWTTLDGERVKIHRATPTQIAAGRLPPGSLGPRESARLLVACGDFLLEVLEIQREGRALSVGSEFLNGLRRGALFG
ncbi:MAG: methionyl-tRNA formyltransferase [Candidatus Bipolaricaulota bacterium]|nr:methionyl-tRNA formyltransferase [Candidatus Bipolaricaulota bacterium]